CLNNGDFGRRLAETCRIYAGGVIEKEIEWGDGFNIERVKKDIDESGAHVLALVQNETSTGVTNAIEAICKYAKSRGMLVLLDTVSAFIGIPLDMRGWGVDIAVAGSQKCIGAPPGMALIGINEGAVKKINDNEIRSYYLNLKKCLKYKEKEETPYTPAVTLYYALDAAIEEVEREGLKNIQERHRRTAEFVRNELVKRGYKLVAEKGFESPTVTAFWGDGKLKDELKKRGVIIAGGQGKLKGKILRIAHLGKFKPEWYKQLFEMIDEIG
ncbi:MAG: aminotransferase class V-fold PLP-dependent enzyme, partial [Candidatus Micrarchaeia archaeon]